MTMPAADPPREAAADRRRVRLRTGLRALLVVGGVAAALAAFAALGTGRLSVEALRELFAPLGPWGPPLYVLAFAVGTVLVLPGTLLATGAALAFGFWTGLAVSVAGATLGACGGFLVGRTIGRGWIERRLARDDRWRRLDGAFERHGVVAVLLLRLLPVLPFNVLNVACGLTALRLPAFAGATALGILPFAALYCWAADTLGRPGGLASAEGAAAIGLLLAVLVGLPLALRGPLAERLGRFLR